MTTVKMNRSHLPFHVAVPAVAAAAADDDDDYDGTWDVSKQKER